MRVLIIGAGLGGLATAIGLKRQNMDVTVYERTGDWEKTHVGGGMQMSLNVMRAFQTLGVAEHVASVGSPLRLQQLHSARGELLGEWPLEDLARPWGLPSVRLTRAKLHRVLGEHIDEGIVHLGAQLTTFTQDDRGVTAHFADGSEDRGDVLIGADGLNSAVRAQLLGKSPPRYAGYAYWRGSAHTSDSLLADGISHMYFGCGTRFTVYSLGPGEVSWFSVANAPAGGTSIDKNELLERHGSWTQPIGSVLEATDVSAIDRTDIVDRDPVSQWGEGRVTLLGDAAHPMTIDLAQGACQTIEDAVVLSRYLRENPNPLLALRTYERARIPRTAQVVKRSRRIGQLFAIANPAFCSVRNRAMKLGMNRMVWKQQVNDSLYPF